MVLHEDIDSKFRNKNNTASRDYVIAAMDSAKLVDAWRILHPEESRFSWTRRKPTVCLSRIDFFLISENLLQMTKSCGIHIAPQTDHSLIDINLEADEFVRGPGNWRFNNTLLTDGKFVADLSKKIRHWCYQYRLMEVTDRWELVKKEISTFCEDHAKKVAHKMSDEERNLTHVAEVLTNQIPDEEDKNVQYLAALEDVKLRISELETIRAEAAAFRSRAQWIREGEKNTKYFFSIEKRNYGAKTMKRLRDGNRIITEQGEILRHQQAFYEALYTSNSDTSFQLTNTSGIRVTEEQNKIMDADLSTAEIAQALSDMQDNKAPGCDGHTTNLYKAVFPEIQDLLLELYMACYAKGRLNPSARRGLINLIPKKKDPSLLKNWRPITLLNLDYKILAKVFATRMKKILPSIIGDQQVGFMKDRNIADNIRKTIDIVSHIYRSGKAALIVSIDYEKCFDKLEFQAVTGSLKYFGFSDKFVQWTNLFFSDFSTCVTNSGFTSELFKKTRGINQGCPISPYYFLVSGETMAHMIKQNPLIKGVQLGSKTHVISQFADDTTLFLTYDLITVNETVKTLTYIEANTGLVISYDKTTVYRIGSIKESNVKFITEKTLSWSSGDIEMLGVTIKNGPLQTDAAYTDTL